MNTTEIAISNGVALPETCQKFCKYFEFNHFKHIWILKDGEWSVELTKHHAKFLPIEKVMPAPQMHEIAIIIDKLDGGVDIKNMYLMSDNHGTTIKNHHYAQAYAELCLQLKEKGLISL